MGYNFETTILLFDIKNVPSFIWTEEGIITLKDFFLKSKLTLTRENDS